MLITERWLNKYHPCADGRAWLHDQDERDAVRVVETLLGEDRLDWANWLIARLLSREQAIEYACFAAEQVLHLFEARYPDDTRPREAIEAARRCITDTSADACAAADAAADARDTCSTCRTYAAADAAVCAARARAAVCAAVCAACAGACAADAAGCAGAPAAYAPAAYARALRRIVEHGLQMLAARGGKR